MTETQPFENVQRIVLCGKVWEAARHLVLSFPQGSRPLGFLCGLKTKNLWPTPARMPESRVQVSLGFSRRGLERALVPLNVLARLALKAPAFSAGAALRANSQLGASGCNVPDAWDKAFGFMTLDAVLSLHGMSAKALECAVAAVREVAKANEVLVEELPEAGRLKPPPDVKPDRRRDRQAQWVHFGYLDGLARVGIEGWTKPHRLEKYKPTSRYPAGEFVLGYAQKSGANPWIADYGLRVWPENLRAFFLDSSFGVLHQIEQDVAAFESFVAEKAQALGAQAQWRDWVKAKLCGRYPDGRRLADKTASPNADFDYANDPEGTACPFGSHVRRMNPRGGSLAHSGRPRPLLRRGMPYGIEWTGTEADGQQRGLIGHFFCASIEDQFEHVLGEWAERVPLGSEDRGQARDPLIGAHEHGDGALEIPRPGGQASLMLKGLHPFTRTRGTAYLFYPSLLALQGIAEESFWGALSEDDE